MRGRSVLLSVLAACGRFGFGEPGGDALGSSADSSDSSDSSDGRRQFLFEDGFEDTFSPWTALGGASVVSGPPAPVEGNSILLAQAATSSSARAEVALGTVVTGTFYVRAYYYYPSGYTMVDHSVLEIRQNADYLVLGNFPEVGVFSEFQPALIIKSSFEVPRDVWICVEVRVGLAPTTGTWDVWIDGVLRHSAQDLVTTGSGVDALAIGITWAGPAQAASTVYVDAVAADPAPIGCL